MSTRAKELAEAHWNNYIKPLLEAHGEDKRVMKIVEFHYLATAVHFHGHGAEDQRNGLLSGPVHPFDDVVAGRLPAVFGPFVPHTDSPPLPDPWDRCACGKAVAECGCGAEAVQP